MLHEFTALAAAAILFVGGHFALSAAPVRRRLVAALGERGFLAVYSAVALAAFAWLVWSYGKVPYVWVWGSPQWARIIAFAAMPIAATLVTAGVLTRNPSAVGGESALRRDDPAPGIFKITRQPVMIGISLWAFVHLLANGYVGSSILFGSLLILALGGVIHMETRRRASGDPAWQRFAAVTSVLPFAAILHGRTRFAFSGWDWARLAVGLALYAGLLVLHGPAFGVYLLDNP